MTRDRKSAQALPKLQALGRVTGSVAHDFNNLLTVIIANVDLAEMGTAEERARCLSQIRLAAESGERLVRQLLSRSESAVTERRRFNLGDLVTGCAEMISRIIEERIQVHVDLDPATPDIVADRTKLERVLVNLVLNARDAISGMGNIWVSTARHINGRGAVSACLTVRDDGHGMDAETQARLFEPFFSTKGEAGTGLGLAAARTIVADAGGRIDVRSRDGSGTTFELHFPAAGADRGDLSDEAAAAEADIPPSPHSASILVVEDDEPVRDSIRRLLVSLGHTVTVAAAPSEALAIAGRSDVEIDLLLADLVMPEMPGLTLGARLKADRPRMKVLYVSGYERALADATAAHAECLSKPFSQRELARRVTRLMSQEA